MKIGLVGAGVIGGAFKRWQEKNTKNDLSIFDPDKGFTDDLSECEAIFICLPAPTTPSRMQDVQAIELTIKKYKHLNVPFFLRSTVVPGTCDRLSRMYEVVIHHVPEFLTERQADEDIKKHLIVIGDGGQDHQVVSQYVQNMFPGKLFMTVSNVEAEISKYTSNCFGALKVHYFNTVYALCKKMNADYYNVLAGAMTPGFIESSHTMVPGPDGRPGFGGHCLPKDLRAFIGCLAEHQVMNSYLRRVESENTINREFSFGEISANNLPI